MKNYRKILTLMLVLICIMTSACDFGWGWVGDDDDDDDETLVVETLSTTAIATVVEIYTIEHDYMDVVTGDGVVLTCDLPGDPVLIEGDIVEIIINFESPGYCWTIIDVYFDKKII
ncbi:hypothetical protein ES703_11211 [subsurface metagenome]